MRGRFSSGAKNVSDLESIIRRVHESPLQVVVVVTGGGSRALAELLSVPGASKTLLEGLIPYSQRALEDFLGFRPQHFVSDETAVALARKAHGRALALRGGGAQAQVLGLSCTAALRTDRPKKGDHRAHIAVHGGPGGETTVWSVVLSKGARDRRAEEEVVADLMIRALAERCGVAAAASRMLLAEERLTVRRVE